MNIFLHNQLACALVKSLVGSPIAEAMMRGASLFTASAECRIQNAEKKELEEFVSVLRSCFT
jgi:hypothetical protein